MRGPKGATVTKELKVESKWTFTAGEIRKRLRLPDDAKLVVFLHVDDYSELPAGETVAIDIGGERHPLIATSTETKAK